MLVFPLQLNGRTNRKSSTAGTRIYAGISANTHTPTLVSGFTPHDNATTITTKRHWRNEKLCHSEPPTRTGCHPTTNINSNLAFILVFVFLHKDKTKYQNFLDVWSARKMLAVVPASAPTPAPNEYDAPTLHLYMLFSRFSSAEKPSTFRITHFIQYVF